MAAQCPICSQELTDVDAVRQHTMTEHGIAAGHDPMGQWTTVAGPADPSWQPDPWNAGSVRWWDGTEWTGRVAPAGSNPADPRDEAPAPPVTPIFTASAAPPARARVAAGPALEMGREAREERASSSAPTFGRQRGPVVPIAVAAIVAVVIVGIVVFTSSAGSPPKANSNLPLTPQAVTASGAQQGLASGLLGTQDLGTSWTPHPAGHPMAAVDYTRGPCGSALWAHDVAGFQASFINGAATEQSHGAVVNEVRQAQSATQATQQRAYVTTPGFVTCLEQTDGQEALSQLPGARLGHVTAVPYPLSLPASTQATVSSVAFVVTIPITAKGGGPQTITDESVLLFSGPYEATLDVSWSSLAPLGEQIVQLQADAQAIHLAALPGA